MEIIPPDFLIIPYLLIIDDDINAIDEKLYGCIYWFSLLKRQKCTASNKVLAELLKSTPNSIGNSLQRLEEKGYIKRLFFDKSKRHRQEIIPLVRFAKVQLADVLDTPTDGTDTPVSGCDTPTDGQNNNNKKEKQRIITNKKELAEQAPQNKEIPLLIDLFKEINPSYRKFFANTTQRAAIQRLLDQHGFEAVAKILAILPQTNSMQYAPVITTPVQLEDKFASLGAFIARKKIEINNPKLIKI